MPHTYYESISECSAEFIYSPIFHDLMEGGQRLGPISDLISDILKPSDLKFVTLSEIRNTKTEMNLLFVVTEDFQTILAHERLPQEVVFLKGTRSYDYEKLYDHTIFQDLERNQLITYGRFNRLNPEIIDFASHADLAQGKPVRAAGMLSISKGGILKEAIIGSENYSPTGETLPVMKISLRNFGLHDIDNIKIKVEQFHSEPIITYDALSRQELMREFKLSASQVNEWLSGRDPKLEGITINGDKFDSVSTRNAEIKTPYGEWRRDLQLFNPKSDVPTHVWQSYLKEQITLKAKSSGLLFDLNFQAGGKYQFDFLPARYAKISEGQVEYRQIVLDYSRNLSPQKLKELARNVEGQGNWELGHYYRTFSAPREPHETILAKVIQKAKYQAGEFNADWRIFATSDKHQTLSRPSLPQSMFSDKKSAGKKTFSTLDALEDAYFDPKKEVLFFGRKFFDKDLSRSQYREILADTLSSLKKPLSSVVSVTFRRVLPVVAIGVSVDNVVHAEDKIDAAIHESTIFAGGMTGAGVGALAGAPFGPPGMLAGALIVGFAGTEASDAAYRATKRFSQKQAPSSTADFSSYHTDLNDRLHNIIDPGINDALKTIPKKASSKPAPTFKWWNTDFSTGQSTSNINIHDFLEQHYLPVFKYGLDKQKQENQGWFASELLQDLQNDWFAGPSDSPFNQLLKQYDNLDYLIKHQSYFLTQEGKTALFSAQKTLRHNIDQYSPADLEKGRYYTLKNNAKQLDTYSSKHLPEAKNNDDPSNLNPKLKTVFEAKSSQEFRTAWDNLQSDDPENAPNSEADQAARAYLKDHFAYAYGDQNLKLSTQKQMDLEKIYMLDNAGRAGMELAKIAFLLGNKELGKALTLAGSVAQGVSSAMLFMANTGAAALGNVVGILGAVSSIISIFSDSDDGLQEAFQEIFNQIILLRQELHELRQFMMQFKSDLFLRLDAYFYAMLTKLNYQEEIVRNGFSKITYEHDLLHEGVDAILGQLNDEKLYEARAFYKGTRDLKTLSREKIEQLLTALWLQLDKASSNYQSGVSACQAQFKNGVMAAASEMNALLHSPLKRGQLPGYLNCYYQTNDWAIQNNVTITFRKIINPVQWNEVVKLYLYLRRTPNAKYYDPKYTELNAVIKQGSNYLEFIEEHQANFAKSMEILLDAMYLDIENLLKLFEYPETARKLIQQYPAPQNLKDIMNRYPNRGGDRALRDIPNVFFAFEALQMGKFISKSAELRYFYCDNDDNNQEAINEGTSKHYMREKYGMRTREANMKHSIQFQYNYNEYQHSVNLARITPSDDQHVDGTHPGTAYYDGGRHATSYLTIRPGVFITSGTTGEFDNIHTQAKNLGLSLRRNISSEMAAQLEQYLPGFQRNITQWLWHAQALLMVAGAPEELIRSFPSLSLPEELSPWVNPYRSDLHHEDLYRALPQPTTVISALSNYMQSLNNFSALLTESIKNYSETFFDDNLAYGNIMDRTIELYRAAQKKSFSANDADREYTATDTALQCKAETSQTAAVSPDIINILQTTNQLLQNAIAKIDNLEKEVNRLKSEANIFLVDAAPDNLDNVLSTWPYKILLSDEREYYNPQNPHHRILARKLTGSWSDVSTAINSCEIIHGVKTCVGDEIEIIDYRPVKQTPSIATTMDVLTYAAINGAVSAALPEAIGDLLHLYAGFSQKDTQAAKKYVHIMMMVLFIGSMKDLGMAIAIPLLAWAITNILIKAGLPESNAYKAGHVMGFFARTGRHLTTPLGVASVATHLVAAEAALFVERECIKRLRY